MNAEPVLPGEISSLIEDPTFRVVLWNRPRSDNDSWFSDEWQFENARDVREVIEWAEAQSATTFEVLIRWETASNSSTAEDPSEVFGYTRVAGSPGESSPTTRVEVFPSTD